MFLTGTVWPAYFPSWTVKVADCAEYTFNKTFWTFIAVIKRSEISSGVKSSSLGTTRIVDTKTSLKKLRKIIFQLKHNSNAWKIIYKKDTTGYNTPNIRKSIRQISLIKNCRCRNNFIWKVETIAADIAVRNLCVF